MVLNQAFTEIKSLKEIMILNFVRGGCDLSGELSFWLLKRNQRKVQAVKETVNNRKLMQT